MGRATGMPCADYQRVGGQRIVEFDGTPLSPREVWIARQAFDAGIEHALDGDRLDRGASLLNRPTMAAVRRYPMPTVTRPREVVFNGANVSARFKVVDGTVLCRPTPQHNWYLDTFTRYASTFVREPQLLVTLFDLLTNPTEEVEAE